MVSPRLCLTPTNNFSGARARLRCSTALPVFCIGIRNRPPQERRALAGRGAELPERTDPPPVHRAGGGRLDQRLRGQGSRGRVDGAANVRGWRRDYDRATKIPVELVEDHARTKALANGVWIEARQRSDFEHFAPILAIVNRAGATDGGPLGATRARATMRCWKAMSPARGLMI